MMGKMLTASTLVLALAACNASRGSDADRTDVSGEEVAQDVSGDAVEVGEDVTSDVAPDAFGDAELDAASDVEPTDIGPVDAGTLDAMADIAAPDATPDTVLPSTDAPLVVYVVDDDGRQVLEIMPADGSRAPSGVARFEDFDLSRPAFSPSGERIAFLYGDSDGPAGVGIVSLVEDGPPQLVGDQGLLELYDVEWGDEDTLHVTAYGPADQIRDAVVTVFSLPLSEPVGPYAIVHPGETGQILSAYPAPETGFGYYYLRVEDPPHGDIWFDTQGGMIPGPVTNAMPIAGDFAFLSPERFLFTDGMSRAHVGRLTRFEEETRFDAVSAGGVQDFRPRALQTSSHYVSSRYPEEVSARPTDRDLVLVSIETGEVVRRLTNTPGRDERDADVQADPVWQPTP